ncbi:hypothetical protein [Halopiger xanaduensis]|uniref:hypothetical protein n=1 Tax=Halopiger xanaduensis TaxID=387343 RepID=UPI001493FAF1|nr:hypothetical protein [Halopiger xanaduensis]
MKDRGQTGPLNRTLETGAPIKRDRTGVELRLRQTADCAVSSAVADTSSRAPIAPGLIDRGKLRRKGVAPILIGRAALGEFFPDLGTATSVVDIREVVGSLTIVIARLVFGIHLTHNLSNSINAINTYVETFY